MVDPTAAMHRGPCTPDGRCLLPGPCRAGPLLAVFAPCPKTILPGSSEAKEPAPVKRIAPLEPAFGRDPWRATRLSAN